MKALLKLEFRRAINKKFIVVLLIGILLTLFHLYTEVWSIHISKGEVSPYVTPFTKWFANDSISIYSQIFLMQLPIVASIPYADSYWMDKNSGFVKGIYTRVKKTDYLISKYITNFIIGGSVIAIPLIFNIYILFMKLPALKPSIFYPFDVPKEMFANLYYIHPYVYVLAYLFMNFMFGGLYASIGLSISSFCKNKFLVVAIPFLAYISMFIIEIAGFPQLVPMKFLDSGQPVSGITIIPIVIIFITLFICSLLVYSLGVKKDEVI